MRIPLAESILRAIVYRTLPERALEARREERHGRGAGGLDRGGRLLRALGHHLVRARDKLRLGVGIRGTVRVSRVKVRVGVGVGVGVRVSSGRSPARPVASHCSAPPVRSK